VGENKNDNCDFYFHAKAVKGWKKGSNMDRAVPILVLKKFGFRMKFSKT